MKRRERYQALAREAEAEKVLVEADAPRVAELERTWAHHKGVYGFLTNTHHTVIAKRFLVTALAMFLIAGLEALLMRIQLARPEHRLVSPDFYNQLFTTHGSTMMFLFAVPVMQALGIYFVPLMVGCRNVAFPRLLAYSYFCYLTACLFLYWGFFTNTGPDAGWFAYTPLSGPGYSAGKRIDVWAQMITFSEISGLGVAVNLIVTILKHRTPGMSLDRMPLFLWTHLVTAFMVVFSMPAIVAVSSMLASDRLIGTHFFNHAEMGDHLLYQHLFWFFGHPEVYIIFLPALGIVSSVIVAHTQRPLIGYLPIVLSTIATAFIGFGVWVHHMFATGLPQIGHSFFTAASMMIVIPTGVQFFCWIATMWAGKPRWTTAFLFIVGFFVNFLCGGLSGVMLASVPIDMQVHDTFFVVAHFHYVLIGGMVFPLFAGLYHWLPKITGRLLDERLGKVNFALFFVGFNLVFFPMHQLGYRGMPRRVWTYPGDRGWSELNMLATIGAFVLGVAVLVFLVNLFRSLRTGAPAGNDPWNADSLEWSTPSPPPAYNFEHLKTVCGRYALWEASPDQAIVTGLRVDKREVLITELLDARPDHKVVEPGPGIAPFLGAVVTAINFIGLIFSPWFLVAGVVLAMGVLVGWFWPRGKPNELLEEQP